VATAGPGLKDGGNLRSVTIPGNPLTSVGGPPQGITLYTAVAVRRRLCARYSMWSDACRGAPCLIHHHALQLPLHHVAEVRNRTTGTTEVAAHVLTRAAWWLQGNLAFTGFLSDAGNHDLGPSYITVTDITGGKGGRPKVVHASLLQCCRLPGFVWLALKYNALWTDPFAQMDPGFLSCTPKTPYFTRSCSIDNRC